MGAYIRNFVELFVFALWLLVLGRVIVSWVDPGGRHPAARWVIMMTEPVLAPIRRVLPSTGTLDLSPLLLMLALGVLLRVVGI